LLEGEGAHTKGQGTEEKNQQKNTRGKLQNKKQEQEGS
jgi:hypothetical protein